MLSKNATAISDKTIVRFVTLKEAAALTAGAAGGGGKLTGSGGTQSNVGGFTVHQFPNIGSTSFTLS